MIPPRRAKSIRRVGSAFLAGAICSATAFASTLDDIGVTRLRAEVPWLTGGGVIVAQPEATRIGTAPYFDYDNFEINPSTVNVPITYINKYGLEVAFDSAYESGHADAVTSYMAGVSAGVATGLSGIVNLNANYYINHSVAPNLPITQSPQVVNQSFIMVNPQAPFTADVLNQMWDSYVAQQGCIIVSGAGNGGNVQVPATAYNVIAVGAYGGGTSVSQSGQLAKPDITAPADVTSYSAPLVSGAAAILYQAAQYASYYDGRDPRVVKALLLNGAVKPGDWTHDSAVPLDRRYGAGVLNVYNSYRNLQAGEFSPSATEQTAPGHHPPATEGEVGSNGWSLCSLSSSDTTDGVDHYVVDLSQNPMGVPLILTATLTWQRAADEALTNEILTTQGTVSSFTSAINAINNLDLYLVDSNTQAVVNQSVSTIDNVEHLYVVHLTPGKYDLEIVKNGGNIFSASETYGFAWNATSITAVKSVTNNTVLTFGQPSPLTVSATILGVGTLIQSGPSSTTLTGGTNYGGPTVIAGGTLVFGGSGVEHTIGNVSGSGVLQVNAGCTLTSGSVNMPSGTLSIDGVHVIASSSAVSVVSVLDLGGSGPSGWTGRLDLKNNDLIVHNGTSNIASQIFQAANKGVWNATLSGITSSTAAASGGTNPKMALAYAAGSEYLTGGRTTFDGQTVVATDELVMYTLAGDANMDGKVTFADFQKFQNGYGKAGYWAQGDFNYDGRVTFADFQILQNNYGRIYTPPIPQSDSVSLGDLGGTGLTQPLLSIGGGASGVPEPASLAVLALGAVGLLTRRRRGQPPV